MYVLQDISECCVEFLTEIVKKYSGTTHAYKV